MDRYTALRAALVLVVVPLVIPMVLGIGVTIEPATIADRAPISIALSNVTDGAVLNTTLTATFFPVAGVTWLNLTNWNYPFALEEGRVVLAGQNVNQLILLMRAGSTITTMRQSGAGSIDLKMQTDLQPYTYHDFRIGYEVHNKSAPLTFTLIQQGMKVGTETDAVLTPSILGVTEGDLTVAVLVNGTLENRTKIRIQPAPPATPEPVVTPVIPATNQTTPATIPPTTIPPTTIPTVTTPPARTPARPPPTPPPATPVTTPPTPEAPSGDFSPFIIAFAAIIILVAIIGDYLLLRD
jgi:hypothetical protein